MDCLVTCLLSTQPTADWGPLATHVPLSALIGASCSVRVHHCITGCSGQFLATDSPQQRRWLHLGQGGSECAVGPCRPLSFTRRVLCWAVLSSCHGVGALERWSVVYVVVKTDRCSVDNLIDTDTDLVSSLSFRVVLPGFACMMHAGLPE